MNIDQFAQTHRCDPDWVRIMAGRDIRALKRGQRGTYAGFPCTVLDHDCNGMYEIRVPGGMACVTGRDIVIDGSQAVGEVTA